MVAGIAIAPGYGLDGPGLIQLYSPATLSSKKQPPVPLHISLDGPQSRSGRCVEDKHLLPCREPNPGLPVAILSIILTVLSSSRSFQLNAKRNFQALALKLVIHSFQLI
jgi:hypothetical protein